MAELGFWELFGILGTFASVISLFISSNSKWSRCMHAAYTALVVALILGFVDYRGTVNERLAELTEIKRVERQASALSNPSDLSTRGNMLGYSLSVLAFLEKNQSAYPGTYERAKSVCETFGCFSADDSLAQFSRMQIASSTMKVLIRGISSLDGNSHSAQE